MNLAAIPEHHVQYLRAHPGAAYGYLHGCRPRVGWLGRLLGASKGVPRDWPSIAAREVAIDENLCTDAVSFHYLLNGTHDPVDAPSDVFQGWITGRASHAHRLGGLRTYAFLHDRPQVAAFNDCLAALDETVLVSRWQDNVRRRDDDPDPLELDEVRRQLKTLREVYSQAGRENQCVLCAPQR